MKIAVASDGKYVSAHFGHCEGFNIYQIHEGKILNEAFKENPGHRPGFLPVFLKELNVDTIIAGGMGEAAQHLFNEKDIQVVVGAQGLCQEVLQEYIDGNLKSSESVCHEHQHEGHCNG